MPSTAHLARLSTAATWSAAGAVIGRGRHALAIALAVLAVATPRPARAEQQERRWSLHGAGGLVTIDAFGTEDSTELGGGGLGIAYGTSDALDLSGQLTYLGRPAGQLRGATVDDLGGEGFLLESNIHLAKLTVGVTYSLAGRLGFGRLRPVLGAAVGVATRVLATPRLVDPSGNMVVRSDATIDPIPIVSLQLGIAHRMTGGFEYALVSHTELGSTHQSVSLALELAWFTYGD